MTTMLQAKWNTPSAQNFQRSVFSYVQASPSKQQQPSFVRSTKVIERRTNVSEMGYNTSNDNKTATATTTSYDSPTHCPFVNLPAVSPKSMWTSAPTAKEQTFILFSALTSAASASTSPCICICIDNSAVMRHNNYNKGVESMANFCITTHLQQSIKAKQKQQGKALHFCSSSTESNYKDCALLWRPLDKRSKLLYLRIVINIKQ
ncbi:unnamed protein product [Ceratitis capitata]|uniref:(Mediterranean fruit fly) hypothetical protein n=1 Tax=Ceratitis capitata TaxID=7213 RepID=A0A811VLH7_CERCA|nr:unnamed protein product [Ceratitis capitata]